MSEQTTIDWNDKPFDEQDLTAYALGAADDLDAATRAAIQAALEADAGVREELAAIEAAAGSIRAALAASAGEAETLGGEARGAVVEAAIGVAAVREATSVSAASAKTATAATTAMAEAAPHAGPDRTRGASGEDDRLSDRGSFLERALRPVTWLLHGSAPQVAGKLAVAGVAVWALGLPIVSWAVYPYVVDECPMCETTEWPERPPLSDLVFRRESDIDLLSLDQRSDWEGDGGTAAGLGAPAALPSLAEAPAAQAPVGRAAESADMAAEMPEGEIPDLEEYMMAEAEEPAYWPPEEPVAPGLPSDFNTEGYAAIEDNPFRRAADEPLSTFSIDVDTASYSNVRRFIAQMGHLPPPSAVRIEEMLNYFDYDYAPPAPDSETPFAVHVEIADAPWRPAHRLVRIGLKGREIARDARPDSNLVFLIDVSGSMSDDNKLPLVKRALGLLVDQLGPRDRVGIVTYAGTSGVALRSTSGDDKRAIRRVIDALGAGGTTAGAAGIQDAYDLASEGFVQGGVNRVILLTDGDFNVGVTSHGELQRIIEDEAKRGIFLSVLGFGMGNYKDDTLELLADKGNGNYGYIDTENEARKLFVEQMSGTLVTIAKDVKIQVEFNPAEVEAYRLIGYENRILAARDFNDDTKDAGEIGAGHAVTALYEVVPAGVPIDLPGIDPLRYGDGDDAGSTAAGDDQGEGTGSEPAQVDPETGEPLSADGPGELLFLKLRHKAPDADVSTRVEYPILDEGRTLRDASADFRFAAGVAAFGMLLRESPHAGDATFDDAFELADSGRGPDNFGYRAELLDLIRRAASLSGR